MSFWISSLEICFGFRIFHFLWYCPCFVSVRVMMNSPRLRRFLAGLTLVLLVGLAAGCGSKASKESHLKRANEYFAAQKYVEANLEYLNVLRLDPTNTVALRNLGLLYHDEGRMVQAFVLLQKVKEFDPADVEVRLRLGQIYVVGRKTAEAQEEARFILSRQPTRADAMVLLADTAGTTNEIQALLAELEKFRSAASGAPEFHVARGTLLFRNGNQKESEEAFRQALKLDPRCTGAHVGLANLFWLNRDLAQADQSFQAAVQTSPLRSKARLRYADFKVKTKEREAGKRMLEEMTKNTPDFLPAWIELAELAYGEKRYDECQSLVAKILASDPVNFDTKMLEGRVAMAKGEIPQAVLIFEKMASAYDKVVQVHHQLALAKLLNKDISGAMASLNEAVKINPNYSESALLLAELNIRQGNHTAAILSLNPLIKQNPKIVRAHILLATAYLGRGSRDDAMAVYRNMMPLFPENPQPPLLLGGLELLNGKTNEARALFEQSVVLAPEYLLAVEQLVELDLAASQFESALTRAKTHVDRLPNAAPPLLLLAKTHWAMTNFPPTEAALTKAIELDPNFRPAYMMLARVYVASNKQKEALEKLEGLSKANPKDANTLLQMGMLYEQSNNDAAARDAYERVIAIDPDVTVALNNLAYLYAEKFNQLDKAFEVARKARTASPSDPSIADTLGWILFKRGDYPWALSLIQESVDNLPIPQAEVFYHLGMTHYMMGEEQPAQTAFEQARKLNTAFAGRDDLMRRLEFLTLDAATAPAGTVDALEKALQTQPGDPVILSKLAAIYERRGDIPKAEAALENALKQNAKNVRAIIQLSRLYAERTKDFEKALALAKQARALAPEDAGVAHMVGRLALRAGDYPWALSLLQDSVRKLSTQPEVLYDLGWSYYCMGRVEEAQASMEQALKLNPNFANASAATRFIFMNNLLLNPDKAVSASDQVAQALAADPNDASALLVAAVIQEKKGNAAEARRGYESLLGRYPMLAPARKRLATVLVESFNDYAGAFEHATKAREAYPKDLDVAKVLGRIMYHRGDFNYAGQLFSEVVSKRPSDAQAYFYLGMTQHRLDRKPQSADALRKALALDGNAPFAEEAKRLLEE